MKKPMKTMLATLSLALVMGTMSAPAFAETINSSTPWKVTFTNGAQMESNFQIDDISELVNDIQPGDTAQIAIDLRNDYGETTNWYMTNKILSSLEESAASASGGAYTYNLTYIAPDNTRTTLFSSDTVGGESVLDDREGLHEVSDAMDEYFMLGPVSTAQNARIELEIVLDGETQGNAYQDTLADLSMDFATELGPVGSQRVISSDLPRTGDEVMTMVPLYIGLAVAGVALLVIAIIGARKRKEDAKGVR